MSYLINRLLRLEQRKIGQLFFFLFAKILITSKALELKRYLSWNSGMPHGQNGHGIENRKQNLLPATRHENVSVSTQVPFQLRDAPLYLIE